MAGERQPRVPVVEVEPEVVVRLAPRFHVVLLDDNDHTYDYVIGMVRRLFGVSATRALEFAREVDRTGRVILLTTSLEEAEFKRDQIHASGPDPQIPRCQGAMSAILERAD